MVFDPIPPLKIQSLNPLHLILSHLNTTPTHLSKVSGIPVRSIYQRMSGYYEVSPQYLQNVIKNLDIPKELVLKLQNYACLYQLYTMYKKDIASIDKKFKGNVITESEYLSFANSIDKTYKELFINISGCILHTVSASA
jgi:predicted transcriptional regulator